MILNREMQWTDRKKGNFTLLGYPELFYAVNRADAFVDFISVTFVSILKYQAGS